MGEFRDLDDVSIQHCFKLWSDSADTQLATLCRGLLYRRLYKTIDLSHLDPAAARAVFERAKSAVEAAGGDVAYDLFYDEPANTPYEAYSAEGDEPAKEILVMDPRGKLTPFGSISPLTLALNRQLMFRRLHVAAGWKAVVEQAVT
jgi:HD superfamily phosphohydrolase